MSARSTPVIAFTYSVGLSTILLGGGGRVGLDLDVSVTLVLVEVLSPVALSISFSVLEAIL